MPPYNINIINKQYWLCITYVTLQLVGLLGMLDVELLGVTGVVMELVAVAEVTGLSLTLFGLQELRLVRKGFVVATLLFGLTFILKVALKFACCQRVHHLRIILHTAQPHLLALLLQVGLLVVELWDGEAPFQCSALVLAKCVMLLSSRVHKAMYFMKKVCRFLLHLVCRPYLCFKFFKQHEDLHHSRYLWRPWQFGRE